MSTKVLLVDADLALLRAMGSEAAAAGGSIELLTTVMGYRGRVAHDRRAGVGGWGA